MSGQSYTVPVFISIIFCVSLLSADGLKTVLFTSVGRSFGTGSLMYFRSVSVITVNLRKGS